MTQLILILASVFIVVLILILMIPSKVKISSDSIKFGKLLKVGIFFHDIEDVNLTTQYPKTSRRVQGFDSGDIKKGIFETPDGRKIRLYLYQEYPPFIEIIHKGGLFVFNSPNPDTTEQQFNEIKSKLKK
jgi:hypothetical protein